MIVTIDAKQYDLSVRQVMQDVQRVAVLTLTDSAKWATDDFIKELKAKVDRPAPFTVQRSGYGNTIAKFGTTGDALFSESFVKPAQARYVKFIIDGGGNRGLGDAGASNKHVWVPGQVTGTNLGGAYSVNPQRSRYGGIPDGYTQKLYDQWKAQQASLKGRVATMSKAEFAATLRKAGKTTGRAVSEEPHTLSAVDVNCGQT